ncbi:MAG: MFS family permease, partial [Myxococcota bacterium]
MTSELCSCAMSSRAQSTWLFGPVSDVFLGAGLLYLLAIFGMTVSGFAVHESMSPATVAILITIFSGTHYGTTLLRVYEHEAERRTYRVFTVYATVAMIAALGGALYSPIAGSLLITIYLTWSPWHYTGQNYGISMMFLRRRGVDVTPRIKSWLHASFILSYVSVFLNFHFEGGISQTDPLGYTSGATSGFQFIGLGLPAVLRTWLLPAVGLGYVVTTFGSIAMLLRGSTLKAVSPALVLLATQAAWFAVPHLSLYFDLDNHIPALNLKGDRNFQAYFLWAALGHAIQYLWITTYYARSDQRWQGYGSFFTKAFVFGNA